MNLIYAEIVAVFFGPDPRLGKIRVGGALKIVSLDLLTDPAPGDRVLLCEGLAIGRVDGPTPKEAAYVSGDTR
jgi:hydrogenase maturation factor